MDIRLARKNIFLQVVSKKVAYQEENLSVYPVKMPKMKFNRIVSKAMPIVKNAVADGINLTSLLPMANRLIKTLDEAQFAFSAADFEADWYEIEKENEASPEAGETEKT